MLKLFRFVLFFTLLLLGTEVHTYAQKNAYTPPVLTQGQLDSLKKYEEALQKISDTMIDGTFQEYRIPALVRFIPTFVQALKQTGSFDYPFDSLKFMQKLTPPDKSFRIYTWLLKYDDATFRYYGVIQMNNPDSTVLFPLRDYRMRLEDTTLAALTLSPKQWIGALYYELIETSHKDKKYYTLLGWDGNNHMSNKKIIEVLTFEEGRPVFGAPIFKKDDKVQNRVIFEFSNDATMMVNYLPEHNMISMDHLVPPNSAAEGQYYTYLPDGTYNYFIFKKGYWVWGEELFDNYRKPIKEAGDIEVEDPKEKMKR